MFGAEARVVSAIRAGIFIDLFGVESYIPLKELSYQRWMDAAAHFQPGQRILVKVLDVDRSDRDHVRVSASVKQAGENPYEKALRRYSVGNRYVGTVSMVDVNGVFVALDGGIDCLCSYPKRGRPPRGARAHRPDPRASTTRPTGSGVPSPTLPCRTDEKERRFYATL